MIFYWSFFLVVVAFALAEPLEFVSKQGSLASTISLLKNGSATDVHMQMWGPKSAGWAAVGLGVMMEQALMFVMYPSANGRDVTVSPRTAKGHVMPTLVSDIKLEITNSSIDAYGLMMADIVCYDCTKWSTGKLSTSSSRQPFVYAVGSGKSIESDDRNAPISIHKSKGVFVGNVAQAFTSASDTVTDEPLPSPTLSNVQPSQRPSLMMVQAHAILLFLVFFGFLPSGVILLRLPLLKGSAFRIHWMLQVFAFAVALAGLGIAINLSLHSTRFWDFNYFHQIIGILVVALMFVQALVGVWHHIQFKRVLARTLISYAHFCLGWIIVIMGMINGTLGFWMLENVEAAGGTGAAGAVILILMAIVSICHQRKRKHASSSRSPVVKHNHSMASEHVINSGSDLDRGNMVYFEPPEKMG